jgi:hypothetical protein
MTEKKVEKPVLEQGAQILRFPSNPESVKQLRVEETLLLEELNRSETYDERVEIRKNLRDIREELYEAIKHTD